ncbi:MAG: hypothetical protein ACI92B_001892 [Marinobacter maritimus]|jgi:hypothetical protein
MAGSFIGSVFESLPVVAVSLVVEARVFSDTALVFLQPSYWGAAFPQVGCYEFENGGFGVAGTVLSLPAVAIAKGPYQSLAGRLVV